MVIDYSQTNPVDHTTVDPDQTNDDDSDHLKGRMTIPVLIMVHGSWLTSQWTELSLDPKSALRQTPNAEPFRAPEPAMPLRIDMSTLSLPFWSMA